MEAINTPEKDKQPTDALGFVFVGSSGSGKSTLRNEICRNDIDGHSFVAHRPVTTRQRRHGEDEYTHVDVVQFENILSSPNVIFSNQSYGNRFLTLWPQKLEPSQHYIYIYLPEAARKLKDIFPNTKIIQIIPSDLSIIETRIKLRDPDINPEELHLRLLSAETEITEGMQIADLSYLNDKPLGESVTLLSGQIGKLLSQ